MTLPTPRAAEWHPELRAGVGHYSEPAQHLLAFLSHTCCQFARLENENGKNLRTMQPFLTNSTHPSEFCSESRSSQGVATDTELEEADMLLRPAATTLRSGEDALLREEDDSWVGMVVQPREREKRGKTSSPTTSPFPAPTIPLLYMGMALGGRCKIRRIIHCRSTIRQLKKKKNRKAQLYG